MYLFPCNHISYGWIGKGENREKKEGIRIEEPLVVSLKCDA